MGVISGVTGGHEDPGADSTPGRYPHRREGRGPGTLFVAASDASDSAKARADYLCTDYSSDDQAIQAAIDALPSGGGKAVLSEGTFTLAAKLQLTNYLTLEGQGRGRLAGPGCTIITAQAALDDSLIELADTEVTHLQIRDLTIDGNSGNQASGDGIELVWTGTSLTNAPRILLQNLIITDCKEDGLTITQPSGMGGGVATLIDVISSWNLARGFTIGGYDLFALGCIAASNGTRGWQFLSGSTNAQLTNCKAGTSGQETATQGEGFYISGAGRIDFVNCLAQQNTRAGFRIAQVQNNFTACRAEDNGETGTRSPGFQVDAGGDRSSFTGCVAEDKNAGNDRVQSYGLAIASGATDVRWSGGAFENNFSGAVSNSGSNFTMDFWDDISDPGDTNTITTDLPGYCDLTTSGGAETRALGDPTFIGQILDLFFIADGGDCVVTAASPINQTGNTQMTFADGGDHLRLVGHYNATDGWEWRVIANDGVALA